MSIYLNTLPPEPSIFKSYSLTTRGFAGGTFYDGGFYEAGAAHTILNQGSKIHTIGGADVPYGAHVFIVASAIGTATGGAGLVEITVSGVSIDDDGTRNAADEEVLVADITTLTTNDMLETVKKWLGTVTITLDNASGSTQTAFALTFNSGFAKYEDFGNKNFKVTDVEVVGRPGANDTGFDIEFIHHEQIGWTYSAAAFVPGSTPYAKLSDDYATDIDLDNGVPFAYKRANLAHVILGGQQEGSIVRYTVGAANGIQSLDTHVGIQYL